MTSGGDSSNPPGLKTLQLDEGSSLGNAVVRSLKAPYRPVLVVILGNEMGQRTSLQQTIIVGRDPGCDLVLTDAGVSWHHARLEDRGDSWAVVDMGSTNGTSVNGEKIVECALSTNDKITFGRTVARFEVQDEMEQAYDELVLRMLNLDDLSGLYVRRKFDAELRTALEMARRKHQPLGLLVMDLDGVKQINDTHGHLFGAYVIGEAGHVIGRVIQGRGMGARFGGDEYIAALPEVDLVGAGKVAKEILDAVGEHHFEREGIVLNPGISIGVAAFPESADDHQTLFQRADEALYRAKQSGKNRVCM